MEQKETIFISVDEAAEYMGVGRDVVKRMIQAPDFPLIYVSSRVRIIKPKILGWLERHIREDFGK